MPDRPSRDQHYLDGAAWAAQRADCRRSRVGALIVKHDRVVGTGRNGAPAGRGSCLGGDCPRGLKSYDDRPAHGGYDDCIGCHAEANALLRTSWDDMDDATMYITREPCSDCWKLILATGIREVQWPGHVVMTDPRGPVAGHRSPAPPEAPPGPPVSASC